MSCESAYRAQAFSASREMFEGLTELLGGPATASMTHGHLEELLRNRGDQLLRCLLQDHLELRSQREARLEVIEGSDGVARTHVRSTKRCLETVFGTVEVKRLSYSSRESGSLSPMDAELNLPKERYSDGLRRGVAVEAARGSYDETLCALGRTTSASVPKRQAEQLARQGALDFDGFYAKRMTKGSRTNNFYILFLRSFLAAATMRSCRMRSWLAGFDASSGRYDLGWMNGCAGSGQQRRLGTWGGAA